VAVRPVLFELGGLSIQSYGVSKALAALVAGWLLARELRRRGRDAEPAFALAVAGLVGGFAGAKVYYLLQQAPGGLTAHDFGSSGFTWYGGLLGGALAVWLLARRNGIALPIMAGMTAIPLAVAYGGGWAAYWPATAPTALAATCHGP
jgi:phosphatidylglycerol:prolipoprotein diacylglycerol transferase